jgi:cytidyltransferase-like protein
MTVILTIGTFDLVHKGHLELLRACRDMAGEDGQVVVAVNDDDFVARFKGHPTIVPMADRMELVGAIRYVDAVCRNTGAEFADRVIAEVLPDILAVGDDWAPPADYLGQLHVSQRWLDDHGVRIVYVPRTTGESSTRLRNRLAAREKAA